MKPFGIIFDADGTLLDSMGIWKELGARYLNGLGIKAGDGLAEILFTLTIDEGCAYIKEKYGLSQSSDEIKQGILKIISGFYLREVQAKPGVSEFLKKLSEMNIPAIIATAGDRYLLEHALKRIGISDYFKGIFTCSELNTTKNEPYIYETAAQFMGTKPEETFVFEDALHAIQTAKRGGFKTVAVEDFSSSMNKEKIKSEADFYMKNFSDFDAFISFADSVL